MLFIYPMWDSENQRIGKQKCTPLGYKLHGIAELLGFIGLVIFVIVCIYLWVRHSIGMFNTYQFWWMAIPIGIGIVAETLYVYSWRLAARKGFQYDYKTGEASWIDDGERQTLR
jgi:4-hydroxybenzoate polyprenyltransferase